MLDAPGAGLAAPQIGVGLRVFTWHVDGELGHLVNPDLTLSEEIQDGPEGCLSLPGLSIDCKRALHVVARGFDMHGEPVTIEGSELPGPRDPARDRPPRRDPLPRPARPRGAASEAMRIVRESEWFGEPAPVGEVLPARDPRARPVRVVFAGTPEVALPALEAVAASAHDLVGVVTRPDAPAGRGRRLVASPVGAARRGARRAGAQAGAPPRTGVPGGAAPRWSRTAAGGGVRRAAAAVGPGIPAQGWVNLHFSVLPAWRGAAPVQHAIWAGDEVTGATTFRIVKRARRRTDLRPDDPDHPPDRHRG